MVQSKTLFHLSFALAAAASVQVLTPAGSVPDFSNLIQPLNNQAESNQCPGTMIRYHFPPVGYKAKKETKSSQKGREIYRQLECMQCHAISGIGGELGPPLDGIGAYRGKTWLRSHLSDPEGHTLNFPIILKNRSNIMPHPGLTPEQAEQIADYLLTLPEPKAGFSITHHKVKKQHRQNSKDWKPQETTSASVRGKELFFGLRCASCHSTDGSKDRFGPDLAGIGSRLSDENLHDILTGSVDAPVMKSQAKSLSESEVSDIQAFLLTLPKREK